MIDAARLLARPAAEPARRFLVVRAGAARIALQVDDVVDLRALGDGGPERRVVLGAPAAHAALAALHDVLRDARWLDDAVEGRA